MGHLWVWWDMGHTVQSSPSAYSVISIQLNNSAMSLYDAVILHTNSNASHGKVNGYTRDSLAAYVRTYVHSNLMQRMHYASWIDFSTSFISRYTSEGSISRGCTLVFSTDSVLFLLQFLQQAALHRSKHLHFQRK